MKKVFIGLLTAVMFLAVIYAAGEDADGNLVASCTLPALAIAGLCALGLNRLTKNDPDWN